MNTFFKSLPEYIYIHLPFCAKRCHYCDFVALAAHENFMQPYHLALLKEIKLVAGKLDPNRLTKIKTIFLGGGTPSLYPTNYLEDLFQTLSQNMNIDFAQEITIEANPVDIAKPKLEAWQNLGINRISIGVQVLDDNALVAMNRPQRVDDVLKAIDLASSYFKNISIDLILGLPQVSRNTWVSTLNTVVTWPINHVSVYMLTIYEKTPIYFKLKKGEIELKNDDELTDLYGWTLNFLNSSGFYQYEISNFAKPGSESLHNNAYWMRYNYYGFGLSAASFDGKNRYANEANIEGYIQRLDSKHELPIASIESLDAKQEIMETLMLSLRTRNGLDLQGMLYLLKDYQQAKFLNSLERLESQNLLTNQNGNIVLTHKGMLIENEIILTLCNAIFEAC